MFIDTLGKGETLMSIVIDTQRLRTMINID